MSRRFELVVFDWDGTICDSTAAIAAAIQDAADDVGLPRPSDERARHVIGLGLADALAYALPELEARDQPRLLDAYRRHWTRRSTELTLFAGMRELLTELHASGRQLAVATGKSAAGLAHALEEANLGRFFAATRCADQTEPKPHPAMLNEITAALAVAPARTVMIGDTSHDLRMAEAAGVASIAVTYGAHPRVELERYRPIALAATVRDLAAVLRTDG